MTPPPFGLGSRTQDRPMAWKTSQPSSILTRVVSPTFGCPSRMGSSAMV